MNPPPPTRQNILADFQRLSVRGDARFQAVRVVSRWIRCGYNLGELPALMTGLTPDIVEEGKADAARILAG